MIVNKKLGLTLSGGGFRGLAHLGIIQYLQELEIEISAISGASSGALVGAFIAEGYSPQQVLQFTKDESFFGYSNFSMRRGGLFSTDIFERIIQKYIPHNSFEGLKIPLYVSVSDLTNAQSLIFNQGDLAFAVKSSCCFPLVFQPVPYKGGFLCDGGVMNNFPVDQIRATCFKSIGINVSPLSRAEGLMGYRDIVQRIIRITTSSIKMDAKQNCDFYLEPEGINQFTTFDANKLDDIFQLGYDYAKKFQDEFLKMKDSLK